MHKRVPPCACMCVHVLSRCHSAHGHVDACMHMCMSAVHMCTCLEVCVHICACVCVCVCVTQGLEDQLLGDVVRKERPDLEEARDRLVLSISNDKRQLAELEDKVRTRVSVCMYVCLRCASVYPPYPLLTLIRAPYMHAYSACAFL